MIAEGVRTAKSAYDLGKKYGIELPIIEQVYQVLYEGKSPKNAVNDLMMRKPKDPKRKTFWIYHYEQERINNIANERCSAQKKKPETRLKPSFRLLKLL